MNNCAECHIGAIVYALRKSAAWIDGGVLRKSLKKSISLVLRLTRSCVRSRAGWGLAISAPSWVEKGRIYISELLLAVWFGLPAAAVSLLCTKKVSKFIELSECLSFG